MISGSVGNRFWRKEKKGRQLPDKQCTTFFNITFSRCSRWFFISDDWNIKKKKGVYIYKHTHAYTAIYIREWINKKKRKNIYFKICYTKKLKNNFWCQLNFKINMTSTSKLNWFFLAQMCRFLCGTVPGDKFLNFYLFTINTLFLTKSAHFKHVTLHW